MTRCKSPLVLRVDVGTSVTWRRGGDIGPAPNRLLFPGRRKRPRGVSDPRGSEDSSMATQTKRRRVSRGGPERGPPLSASPRPCPARSVVPRLSSAHSRGSLAALRVPSPTQSPSSARRSVSSRVPRVLWGGPSPRRSLVPGGGACGRWRRGPGPGGRFPELVPAGGAGAESQGEEAGVRAGAVGTQGQL